MQEYKSHLVSKEMDFLFDAILLLENREECYRFFEDICTIAEVKSIAQRLQVANLLMQKRTYTDIAKESGASTATISRVNKALNYGCDGYNLIFDKMDKLENDTTEK